MLLIELKPCVYLPGTVLYRTIPCWFFYALGCQDAIFSDSTIQEHLRCMGNLRFWNTDSPDGDIGFPLSFLHVAGSECLKF